MRLGRKRTFYASKCIQRHKKLRKLISHRPSDYILTTLLQPTIQADEDMLVTAMQTKTAGLGASSKASSGGVVELKGLPRPQGMHLRFDASGEAVPSPNRERTHLRGMPAPKGTHVRFNN